METSPSTPMEADGSALFATLREFGPSASELDQQRDLLCDAEAALVARHPNSEQQKAIKTAIGMLDWFCFGTPGQELPQGFIQVIHEDESVEVRIDTAVIDTNDVSYVWGEVKSDYPSITGQIPRRPGNEQVSAAISEVLESTEAFRFIQTLLTQAPETRQPTTLSPQERLARESFINSEIRERYNIGSRERIHPQSGIGLHLRQQLYSLDHETSFRRSTSANCTGFQKIRDFFAPIVLEDLRNSQQLDTEPAAGFIYDPDAEVYIGVDASGRELSSCTMDDFSFLLDFASSLRRPGSFNTGLALDASYLEKICNYAYAMRENPNLEECLQQAAQETCSYFEDIVTTEGYQAHIGSETFTARAFLYQATGPIIIHDYDEQPVYHPPCFPHEKRANLLSYDNLVQRRNKLIGYVTTPDIALGPGMRLIQTSEKTPLPEHSPEATLVVNYSSKHLVPGQQPSIPGFKTVSYDPTYEQWGFAHEPIADPYCRAVVPVPQDGLEKLVEAYRQIGLSDLAGYLQDTPNLIVADLTEALQNHTFYFAPDDAVSMPTEKLQDFRRFIQNNTLFAQCNGSGPFLALSLNLAFGRPCTSLQKGHTVSYHDLGISELTHLQVAFTDGQASYLLDATGRSPFTPTGGSPALSTAPPLISKTKPQFSTQPQPRTAITVTRERTPEDIRKTFTQLLLGMYGLQHKDDLYNRIASLRNDDPVWLTTSALEQFNSISLTELHGTRNFLQLIQGADQETLRSARLGQYHEHPIIRAALEAIDATILLRQNLG